MYFSHVQIKSSLLHSYTEKYQKLSDKAESDKEK